MMTASTMAMLTEKAPSSPSEGARPKVPAWSPSAAISPSVPPAKMEGTVFISAPRAKKKMVTKKRGQPAIPRAMAATLTMKIHTSTQLVTMNWWRLGF